LFAAHAARDSLLGIYALTAEWRALRRSGADFRLGDLYNAWNAARRAATAR
jgi:hypothetical protein